MNRRRPRRPPPTQRTPMILCIDDDPEISRVLEKELSPYDVHLVRAFHGMHGMVETLKEKPDLILLDLGMPSGDGATILECLRRNQATAAIPVIILTGRRNPIMKYRLLQMGANQFLHKPVPFRQLLREFRRFVEVRERPYEADVSEYYE